MEDKLVTIAEYIDAIEAEMAKQVLEDFKIPAVVVGPNAGNFRIGALDMVLLQVKEDDADRAKQILESQKQGLTPEELGDSDKLEGTEGPEKQ